MKTLKILRSIGVKQTSMGYVVHKATNLLDIKIGAKLVKEELEKLISQGVRVDVTRNQ